MSDLAPAAEDSHTKGKPTTSDLASPGIMLPPFRFDPFRSALVSAHGIPLPLPHKLGRVIEAMLQKVRLKPNVLRWQLSYKDVSTYYKKGLVEDKFPKLSPEERDERFELFKGEIEHQPEYLAHRFSTELRAELKKADIPKKLIFSCDKRNKCYQLGNGWALKKPLLTKSGDRLLYRGRRDFYKSTTTGKKTPIRSPDQGENED